MSAFAHIGKTDLLHRRIDFLLGYKNEQGSTVYQPNNTLRFLANGEHNPNAEPVEPTFSIEEDVARALLQSLIRHFDGGEDTRSLRRDYDAERVRVDKLIEYVARPPTFVHA